MSWLGLAHASRALPSARGRMILTPATGCAQRFKAHRRTQSSLCGSLLALQEPGAPGVIQTHVSASPVRARSTHVARRSPASLVRVNIRTVVAGATSAYIAAPTKKRTSTTSPAAGATRSLALIELLMVDLV